MAKNESALGFFLKASFIIALNVFFPQNPLGLSFSKRWYNPSLVISVSGGRWAFPSLY